MLGESHELVEEFPEHQDLIQNLRATDNHFADLFDDYHKVNSEVIRIEQGLETPADAYTDGLKKLRLLRKDQLYKILQTS